MYLKSFSQGGSAAKAWKNFLWVKDVTGKTVKAKSAQKIDDF